MVVQQVIDAAKKFVCRYWGEPFDPSLQETRRNTQENSESLYAPF
jgi:hypothetical protein